MGANSVIKAAFGFFLNKSNPANSSANPVIEVPIKYPYINLFDAIKIEIVPSNDEKNHHAPQIIRNDAIAPSNRCCFDGFISRRCSAKKLQVYRSF